MNKLMKIYFVLFCLSVFAFGVGCGKFYPVSNNLSGYYQQYYFSVRAKALIGINNNVVSKTSDTSPYQTNIVVNDPQNVQFQIDSSNFNIPSSFVNDSVSFGYLSLTNIKDNDLKQCGLTGHDKCTQAIIRAYTLNTPGSGLWNFADNYGIPLLVNGFTTVLGSDSNVILTTLSIPANENVLHFSNFAGLTTYNVSGDFSNAGMGQYSTTLVIEYDLQ